MSEQDKAKELIDSYSKVTGFSIQSLNGWMLREMAVSEIRRLIKELENIEFNYDMDSQFKEVCLSKTTIPYYERVINELVNNY
jgi:hypothetical protein